MVKAKTELEKISQVVDSRTSRRWHLADRDVNDNVAFELLDDDLVHELEVGDDKEADVELEDKAAQIVGEFIVVI